MSCTGLEKYSSYKLRVAASTAVGESPPSEDDYIFVVTLEDGTESFLLSHADIFLQIFQYVSV